VVVLSDDTTTQKITKLTIKTMAGNYMWRAKTCVWRLFLEGQWSCCLEGQLLERKKCSASWCCLSFDRKFQKSELPQSNGSSKKMLAVAMHLKVVVASGRCSHQWY